MSSDNMAGQNSWAYWNECCTRIQYEQIHNWHHPTHSNSTALHQENNNRNILRSAEHSWGSQCEGALSSWSENKEILQCVAMPSLKVALRYMAHAKISPSRTIPVMRKNMGQLYKLSYSKLCSTVQVFVTVARGPGFENNL